MKHIKIVWATLLLSVNIFPQWGNNPDINLQLTNWGDAPISAVEDGRGGAFISTSLNVPLNEPPWSGKLPYLLWVDKYGYHKITTPYRIGGYSSKHRDMKLMKDGTGNYFAIFVDQFFAFGPPSIYKDRIIIQKLDPLGNKLLGEGVYISTDTVMQHTFFEAVSDGKGGCFIYYEAMDSLGSTNDNGQRLVQYISSNGERLWGDKGVTLYDGFIRTSIYSNYLICDNANGLIVHYENDQDNINYLSNLDSTGFIKWEIPTREFYATSRLVLLNQNKFAIIGLKVYENPLSVKLMFDKISLSGIYEDTVITLNDSMLYAERVECAKVIDDKIFIEWYERPQSTIFINYIQKIDSNGIKYFGNKGIQVLDSLGSWAKMFFADSSIIIVTDHYANTIDFEGNNLWEPNILQYTTRYMGYYDVVSDDNGGFIAFWLQYLDGIWGQQVNANGQLGVVTNIFELPREISPDNFKLYQNYPNPFNPVTTINYTLPTSGYVELKVFDVLGREIIKLERGEKSEGLHSVIFDGRHLSSGVYFYTILVKESTSNNVIYKSTKKMLSIK